MHSFELAFLFRTYVGEKLFQFAVFSIQELLAQVKYIGEYFCIFGIESDFKGEKWIQRDQALLSICLLD